MKIAVAAGLVLVASGCGAGARVLVPDAPNSRAPLPEREQALLDWSPAGKVDQAQLMILPSGLVASADVSTEYMQLNNGVKISDPRDLLPLVRAESDTATSALEFGSHQVQAQVSGGIGSGLVVASLALVATALTVSDEGGRRGVFIAAGIGLLSSLVPFIWCLVEGSSARSARESAFLTYGNDLRHRLGLSYAKKFTGSSARSAAVRAPTKSAPEHEGGDQSRAGEGDAPGCSPENMARMREGGVTESDLNLACPARTTPSPDVAPVGRRPLGVRPSPAPVPACTAEDLETMKAAGMSESAMAKACPVCTEDDLRQMKAAGMSESAISAACTR